MIDSNALSALILVIVYLASSSVSFLKAAKNPHFNLVILSAFALIMMQVFINIMSGGAYAQSGITSFIKFVYPLLLSFLPASVALYVIKQKNPRMLNGFSGAYLLFLPAVINIFTGAAYTMIPAFVGVIPLVFAGFVIFKYRNNDETRLNLTYAMLVAASAVACVYYSVGLAAVSFAVLISFITVEISMAKKDTLTKLNNRKHLYAYMQRLIKAKKMFTVIMFDMDRLKSINDTYGHIKGDKAISDTADIIKAQVRNKDFFARYAGDEFVLIVDTCDIYNVKQLLHRIDTAFAKHNERSGDEYTLAVSSGYHINEVCGKDAQELIELADSSMFKNKRSKLVKNWQTNINLLAVSK